MKNIKNTVTIDLDTYNYLRDFETNIRAKAMTLIEFDYMYGHRSYISNDKVVMELAEKAAELSYEIRSLKKAASRNNPVKQISLKIMSIWQFLKLRRAEQKKIIP